MDNMTETDPREALRVAWKIADTSARARCVSKSLGRMAQILDPNGVVSMASSMYARLAEGDKFSSEELGAALASCKSTEAKEEASSEAYADLAYSLPGGPERDQALAVSRDASARALAARATACWLRAGVGGDGDETSLAVLGWLVARRARNMPTTNAVNSARDEERSNRIADLSGD